MFISITKPERDTFLQQTKDCLMPGYTGHCPTLKFRFGKRYGASTKEIIREMGEKGLWARHIANTRYREHDPVKGLLDGGEFRPIERAKGQYNRNLPNGANRTRPYIMGYTGYIPGMNFIYGKSYLQAADESLSKYEIRKASLECKKEFEMPHRNYERKFQKLQQTYPNDKLTAALMDLEEKYKYKVEHISPEQPPIAGYTGHIPRIKSTETSLSQRYHTAAKRGLYLLQQDRQRYNRANDSLSKPPIPTPVC
ncbi:protein FAM166B-like isoform X1 [Cimex lectularius]|uniref:Uncharacterized protein n=1 Tax=Cimex lectularius TaxID=79782 RepID=A0A8I6THB7_CIMLE|nr:protein FAM166B-like isoform X1 [Cimex lectularius]